MHTIFCVPCLQLASQVKKQLYKHILSFFIVLQVNLLNHLFILHHHIYVPCDIFSMYIRTYIEGDQPMILKLLY